MDGRLSPPPPLSGVAAANAAAGLAPASTAKQLALLRSTNMPRPFGVFFLVCSVGFAAVGSAAAAAAALEQPATTDLERRRPGFCGCAAEGRLLLSQQHARPAATAADAHCAAATCPRASPPLSPKYLARSGREHSSALRSARCIKRMGLKSGSTARSVSLTGGRACVCASCCLQASRLCACCT